MSEQPKVKKEGVIESGVEEMHLENRDSDTKPGRSKPNGFKEESGDSHGSTPRDFEMESATPKKGEPSPHSPNDPVARHEEAVGGDVTLKLEPGQPPKLARSSSHRVIAGPAQLYSEEPDKTEEARRTFQVLSECSYSSKYIGSSSHDYMECDCSEEWGEINTLLHSIYLQRQSNYEYR